MNYKKLKKENKQLKAELELREHTLLEVFTTSISKNKIIAGLRQEVLKLTAEKSALKSLYREEIVESTVSK